MSLNTCLGEREETRAVLAEFEEVLDQSGFCSNKGIFEAAFCTGLSAERMAAESDLLLTEYLLNFEDENAEECSFETEGFSSGVEYSEDEDLRSLSSLKETLKTKKNTIKKTTNEPTGDKCSFETEGFSLEVGHEDPCSLSPLKETLKTKKNTIKQTVNEPTGDKCSFETEGFSSGEEYSEDEDVSSLSSLKETHKTSLQKTTIKQTANKPTGDKPRRRKKYKLAHEKTVEEKEKDRIRSLEYRKRKMSKIKTTEDECKQLKETNTALNEKNVELGEKVSSLEKQIEYLENVIANQSALSSVLGAITKHSGLSFNNNPLRVNSLKRKRVHNENDENEPQKKQSSGGVCLHLTAGRMSLEFCRECDVNAADD